MSVLWSGRSLASLRLALLRNDSCKTNSGACDPHRGKPRKLPKLSMGWCDFFVCDSLACIPHLAISGSGTNAIGLSLIQLLESCQRVLRLLDISAPPIGLREGGG